MKNTYNEKYYRYLLKNINNKKKVEEIIDKIYEDGFEDGTNEGNNN